jgi:hypothetical protein
MSDVEYLLSLKAILERSDQVLALAEQGKTPFKINWNQIDLVAHRVVETTLARYPDLNIPFHSRWTHFDQGRLKEWGGKSSTWSATDRIRAEIDLIVISVLLDAGAGAHWMYTDPKSNTKVGKSEGLALASFDAFNAGRFSKTISQIPFVDSASLESLTVEILKKHFQVSDQNPMDGLEGRVKLLNTLGAVLKKANLQRPSDLFQDFFGKKEVDATRLLRRVQDGFGEIWPGRLILEGIPMGDVWTLKILGDGVKGLVPFHKLSQWLTLSLADCFWRAGVQVSGREQFTALAEYRNGGLLIDSELIELRDASLRSQKHLVNSELVVCWRSLTVALMKPLAEAIRKKLSKSENELPLGKILEGGTWHAGREIAKEKRADGTPPLSIVSDGTVF